MEQEWIKLSDPDISNAEFAAVKAVLGGPQLSSGPKVEAFESEFASYLGRSYGVAAASGSIALMLA